MQEHELILAEAFCSHHQVKMDFIYSLREYGLIQVINNEGTEYLSAEELNELEKIIRLHYDLNLNMEGIDVVLHLLGQLEHAQHEISELRNQLKLYK